MGRHTPISREKGKGPHRSTALRSGRDFTQDAALAKAIERGAKRKPGRANAWTAQVMLLGRHIHLGRWASGQETAVAEEVARRLTWRAMMHGTRGDRNAEYHQCALSQVFEIRGAECIPSTGAASESDERRADRKAIMEAVKEGVTYVAARWPTGPPAANGITHEDSLNIYLMEKLDDFNEGQGKHLCGKARAAAKRARHEFPGRLGEKVMGWKVTHRAANPGFKFPHGTALEGETAEVARKKKRREQAAKRRQNR